MRIAVYKDNLSTGRGADRAVMNFAEAIKGRGHDVALLDKNEFSRLLSEQWDIVVPTGSNEVVDLDRVGYFDRKDRARVILQLHLEPKGFFKWKHPIRNFRIRRAFNRVDVTQVLCKAYEAAYHKIAPRPKLVTIGNFTDIAATVVQRENRLDSRLIIYPAALQHVKNQEMLIKAFARLADDYPNWRVHIIGVDTTKYARVCKRLVKRLGLEGRVIFTGFKKDLSDEYGKAAFVAFPSYLEGFPLTLLEAAHWGLCAISHTALPSAASVIVNGETGVLTKPSVSAYAEGLRYLMQDAAVCRRLGANAHDFCAREYSRQKIVDAWIALFESCLNNGAFGQA